MSTDDTPSPLDYTADAILEDYRRTLAFRIHPNAGAYLHQFFSSHSIPVGLTDSEVAICIRLYPYRKRMVERHNEIEDTKLERLYKLHNVQPLPMPTLADALTLVEAGVHDTVEAAAEHLECGWNICEYLRHHPIRTLDLPEELRPSVVMTREQFRKGIRKFIAQYRKMFGV